jgi:hypothetical protein
VAVKRGWVRTGVKIVRAAHVPAVTRRQNRAMRNAPGDEIARLCEELRAVLEKPHAPREDSLEGLEDMLTEGYARALALEAEQRRIERRIAELEAAVRGGREGAADDVAALTGRLSSASARVARLRALLAGPRRRASAVRREAAT